MLKNLFGTDVRHIETALLKGHSTEIDLAWHCFTDDIQDFIAGSYELGANPLPHLRKAFPHFSWKFHQVDPLSPQWLESIKGFVAKADFFWPACFESEQWFVTANRKYRKDEPWKILASTQMLTDSLDPQKVGATESHPLDEEYEDENS